VTKVASPPDHLVIESWHPGRGLPFTYMVDASRVLTTGPFTWAPVGEAVAVGVGVLVATQLASHRAFSRAVAEG